MQPLASTQIHSYDHKANSALLPFRSIKVKILKNNWMAKSHSNCSQAILYYYSFIFIVRWFIRSIWLSFSFSLVCFGSDTVILATTMKNKRAYLSIQRCHLNSLLKWFDCVKFVYLLLWICVWIRFVKKAYFWKKNCLYSFNV